MKSENFQYLIAMESSYGMRVGFCADKKEASNNLCIPSSQTRSVLKSLTFLSMLSKLQIFEHKKRDTWS